MLTTDERHQAGPEGHVKAALRRAFTADPVRRNGDGDALQRLRPQVLTVEQARYQPLRRGTDHYAVGLREPLHTGSNVRRLTQGQLLMAAATAPLTDHNPAGAK